jgi:hypothetical protein
VSSQFGGSDEQNGQRTEKTKEFKNFEFFSGCTADDGKTERAKN